MVTKREMPRLKPGSRVRVRIGDTVYSAVITDVRGDRIFVTIDPDSDAPLDTFYHLDELVKLAAERIQTVIYHLNESRDPSWQFHSMPESVVGGGKSLDEVRDQYRDALKFALASDQLPGIREYVEREADGTGIWIRTSLESEVADNAFRQVTRQIVGYEDREWFYCHPTAGGYPVVFPCSPDDPLGSIFEQMTPFDSLIPVMGQGPVGGKVKRIMFIVIEGVEARRDGDPPESMDQFGLTRDTPMGEVFRKVLRHYLDAHIESGKSSPETGPTPLAALLAPA